MNNQVYGSNYTSDHRRAFISPFAKRFAAALDRCDRGTQGRQNPHKLKGYCAVLLMTAWAAQAATVSWRGGTGDWNTATNWSPSQVPGSGDSALITASGTYTVTVNSSVAVSSLTLGGANGKQTLTVSGITLSLANGGTVGSNGILSLSGSTLSGLLAVSGAVNWTNGGSLAGGASLTLASNGVLNIGGSTALNLNGVLTNAGTVNWAGTGNLQLSRASGNGNGGIVNLVGGLFNVQNDQTIATIYGDEYFNNAGTFRKSAGTNTTVNVIFNNSGVVDVESGTVTFNGGGAGSGLFHAYPDLTQCKLSTPQVV
jgi:hypothetical protein